MSCDNGPILDRSEVFLRDALETKGKEEGVDEKRRVLERQRGEFLRGFEKSVEVLLEKAQEDGVVGGGGSGDDGIVGEGEGEVGDGDGGEEMEEEEEEEGNERRRLKEEDKEEGLRDGVERKDTSESDEMLMVLFKGISLFLRFESSRFAFVRNIVREGEAEERNEEEEEEEDSAVSNGVLLRNGVNERRDFRSGVDSVAKLLLHNVTRSVQCLYQAIFCLWRLSFTQDRRISTAFESAGIPRLLAQVLREYSTEKIVRITLATLRNIITIDKLLRKEMVGTGLISILEQLCMRRWNDDDIKQDLQYLANNLTQEIKVMSTWELYKSEVLSGALEWGPTHMDENFWKENVEMIEGNNREVLKCLGKLLSQSNDPTVVCVACNDLANVVKYHPRGKYLILALDIKKRLMQLMAGDDKQVRRFALNCVQVLMISKWDLMQRTSASARE